MRVELVQLLLSFLFLLASEDVALCQKSSLSIFHAFTGRSSRLNRRLPGSQISLRGLALVGHDLGEGPSVFFLLLLLFSPKVWFVDAVELGNAIRRLF